MDLNFKIWMEDDTANAVATDPDARGLEKTIAATAARAVSQSGGKMTPFTAFNAEAAKRMKTSPIAAKLTAPIGGPEAPQMMKKKSKKK